MSSSDVFDVLNIRPKSTNGEPTPQPATPAATAVKQKPITGIQRELYSLLGENESPIVLQPQLNNRFKERFTGKPSPWTQVDFIANEKYPVKLKHWLKGSKELLGNEVQLSTYSKFDQQLTLPSFTHEEYSEFTGKDQNIEDNDEWSYDEVKYLFDLCRKYDLRWPIINDRYQFEIKKTGEESKFIQRSIEEIKNKFYQISKKYMLYKDPKDPNIESLNYDMNKELERKLYLERLLSRTAAEIAEEEALIIESKKFEMSAKKTLNERESLLRLLDSPNSDQNVSQYLTSQGISQLYNNLLNDKSKKRKNDSNIPENPWMKQQQQFAQQKQQLQQLHEKRHSEVPNTDSSSNNNSNDKLTVGTVTPNKTNTINNNSADDESLNTRKTKKQRQELQSSLKKRQEAEYAENLVKNFSDDEKKQLGVICHGEKLQPGVYLRSTKNLTFKPALQNKILTVLQELNLPLRPAMPTYDVLKKQEELLRHIVTLLEFKKKLDRFNAEKDITKS